MSKLNIPPGDYVLDEVYHRIDEAGNVNCVPTLYYSSWEEFEDKVLRFYPTMLKRVHAYGVGYEIKEDE